MRPFKLRYWALLWALTVPILVSKGLDVLPDNTQSRAKEFVTKPSAQIGNVDISLIMVSSYGAHLVGRFEIVNNSSTPTIVPGSIAQDGNFWPHVLLEVTTDTRPPWKWQTIGESSLRGKQIELVVKPVNTDKDVGESILVDMDSFKRFTREGTYGRIVFSDGNWTMFDLKRVLTRDEQKGVISPQ